MSRAITRKLQIVSSHPAVGVFDLIFDFCPLSRVLRKMRFRSISGVTYTAAAANSILGIPPYVPMSSLSRNVANALVPRRISTTIDTFFYEPAAGEKVIDAYNGQKESTFTSELRIEGRTRGTRTLPSPPPEIAIRLKWQRVQPTFR